MNIDMYYYKKKSGKCTSTRINSNNVYKIRRETYSKCQVRNVNKSLCLLLCGCILSFFDNNLINSHNGNESWDNRYLSAYVKSLQIDKFRKKCCKYFAAEKLHFKEQKTKCIIA